MAAAVQMPEPQRRAWTRAEFEHLIDVGAFGPEERLELINGEITQKMTQNAPHATAVSLALDVMKHAFPNQYVRGQLPLTLGEQDRPEPDIAVVTGTARDYITSHPTTAELVIEISDATLAFDRTTKASLYARAGIVEYWIVNLRDRVLEVHRQPAPMAEQPLGHHFRSVTRHPETESIAPLAAAETPISVADLLP